MSKVPRIAIVPYNSGNIASLVEAFSLIGASCRLAQNPDELRASDAIVLPGVGHFGAAVYSLTSCGLSSSLLDLIREGVPTMGICLGFQLLTSASEEAPRFPGLGLLPMRTQRIRAKNPRLHKVPHLGWNNLTSVYGNSHLLQGIPPERQLFYFANAYAVPSPAKVDTGSSEMSYSCYRHCRDWLGIVEYRNLFGVQFHPEKSRSQGLQLLRNFLATV